MAGLSFVLVCYVGRLPGRGMKHLHSASAAARKFEVPVGSKPHVFLHHKFPHCQNVSLTLSQITSNFCQSKLMLTRSVFPNWQKIVTQHGI